ncbi:hypothetical protein [Burkholderia contaminans]|uniref:hypothetical protein n=1 Tax=Burkholderia contaminans TaxID=488447 RepID=UPI001582094D|nr:hypothetical protein [Burkholderia contaminans]
MGDAEHENLETGERREILRAPAALRDSAIRPIAHARQAVSNDGQVASGNVGQRETLARGER